MACTTLWEMTQEQLEEAAKRIGDCDFLLIATGAGFSADSGLPTYADVADNAVYQEKGVDYGDLCRVSCLKTNPALFYGFWGSCFNAYQEAVPHLGYGILKKWCQSKQDYYIYTSNVDGHFRQKGFPTNRIHEMHGSIDTWWKLRLLQGNMDSCAIEALKRMDKSYRFPVNDQLEIPPRVLRNSLLATTKTDVSNKNDDKLLFRPQVLLFDDGLEVHKAMGLAESSDRYQEWEAAVEMKMEKNPLAKLVVLEIGCGTRVPSVRRECEDVVADTAKRVQNLERVVHIRINPDEYEIENRAEGTTAFGIQGSALQSLLAMDGFLSG